MRQRLGSANVRGNNINNLGEPLGTLGGNLGKVECPRTIDRLKLSATLEPDDASEIVMLLGGKRDQIIANLGRSNGNALQGV
jgi:hypothetical protein